MVYLPASLIIPDVGVRASLLRRTPPVSGAAGRVPAAPAADLPVSSFARYLLEGLHEDVNRVTSRPKPITTDIDDSLRLAS